MKVGVLGSGDVAKTLASGFLKHGHQVMLGSRTPEKLKDWAADNAGGVGILAVPHGAAALVHREGALFPRCSTPAYGATRAHLGAYRRSLQARADALGLAGRVWFTGFRSDVTAVMAGLDVVVNPSIEESACYTMVEALLMRKGVVASDVGGLPDTVQHRETGLLVPPGDPAALAGAVAELLADPQLRRRLGSRGRDRCLRRFDITATVGQLDGLYRAALARKLGPAQPGPAACG